jgi:hypothetical protein
MKLKEIVAERERDERTKSPAKKLSLSAVRVTSEISLLI